VYVPTFTDLVGDESSFLSEYFDRQPLLRRSALPAAHRELLTLADLDELLYSQAVRPPYIQLALGSQDIPAAAYTKTTTSADGHPTECVDPEKVIEYFRAGATIAWPSINPGRPNLRALASALSARFGVPTDLIAFLSPAGVQTFRPHFDPVDLFIIQLHGTKNWQIWPKSNRTERTVTRFTKDQLGEPLFSTSLRPGDVMYLPSGTPHVVTAKDTMSLHVSMIVRPRRWTDLLQRLVQVATERDPQFWAFPYLNHANQDALEKQLVTSLDGLLRTLAAQKPEQAVAELLAWETVADPTQLRKLFTQQADIERSAD
jgi:ribosomal protein L16 Arg81 hydroxylase